MSVANHCERFRPLRGGIVIVTQARQHYGTLGMIVTRNGIDRWGLTCVHVLGPVGGPVPGNDAVFQPDDSAAQHRIGLTDSACADALLDCAAFKIDSSVAIANEILGIGPLGRSRDPQIGDQVSKSGRSTGVTEGMVVNVSGDIVTIELRANFPNAYDVSEGGDSGAIWCDIFTRAPLALHTSGSSGGFSIARAVRLSAVFAALNLSELP